MSDANVFGGEAVATSSCVFNSVIDLLSRWLWVYFAHGV